MTRSALSTVARLASRGRRAWLLSICLSLTVAGCQWGQRAERSLTATTPAGATVRLVLFDEEGAQEAELFAVDSLGVFVHDGRLRHVAWSSLRTFEVRRFGEAYLSTGGVVPPEAKRRRIALVSRFPQGLEGDLLARVLTQLSQASVERTP